MSNKYSTGFTGCTIEEVPNFDRWCLFKHYQDSNHYNVVLGKNNVDSFLKEFKQIHGIKEDESESDDEPKIVEVIVEKIVEVIVEKIVEKSYNFNLLKQSLDNTCCAICTKSIVDGKIYILDCGHISHETCLNPDIKCQLCDLNEWDIVNQ